MLNNKIFIIIFSFLLGIFLKSFKFNFLLFVFLFLLVLIFYFLTFKKFFSFLLIVIFFIILGGFYYHFYEFVFYKRVYILFNKEVEFKGVIVSNPKSKLTNQSFKLKILEPFDGYVFVKTNLFPQFEYGDLILLKGEIQSVSNFKNKNYFLKEKIIGFVNYPKIELIKKDQANKILKKLYSFKNNIVFIFQKYLKINQAALLSGLILGETSEFEKEFQDKMNKTGTTHIVALSGYNISIFSIFIFNFLRYFINRYLSVIITLFLILAFVLMTGAEASVVRAAIMGLIFLMFYNFYGKTYDLKNVLIFTALIMVLINPFILSFDVGFQLSFLALIGVTFLKESLINILKLDIKESFLNYKDNLITTLSAQLMVLPILLNNFNYFSFLSFLPNIFILTFIPIAMLFGFLLIIFDFLFFPFAFVLSWFLYLILGFKIFVIDFFSKFQFLNLTENLSLFSVLIYYLILLLLINKNYVRKFLSKI